MTMGTSHSGSTKQYPQGAAVVHIHNKTILSQGEGVQDADSKSNRHVLVF